jgi:hypothetical protein
MMLPGALKYGGMPAFAALCAPGELFVYQNAATGTESRLKAAYRAANAADRLREQSEAEAPEKVVNWLLH